MMVLLGAAEVSFAATAEAQGNVYDPLRESWRAKSLLGAEVRMLDGFVVGRLADLIFDSQGLIHSAAIELDPRAGFAPGYIEVLHSAVRFEPREHAVYLAMERETIEAAEPRGSLHEVILAEAPGRWAASRLIDDPVLARGIGSGRVSDLLLSPTAYQLTGFVLDSNGRQLFAVPLDQSWHLFEQDFTELAADVTLETAMPLFLFR